MLVEEGHGFIKKILISFILILIDKGLCKDIF